MVFTLAFSIFDGFKTLGWSLGGLTEQVMKLPLASLGIGWIIPAAIGLVVGLKSGHLTGFFCGTLVDKTDENICTAAADHSVFFGTLVVHQEGLENRGMVSIQA